MIDEILHISGNVESTKKADHILEIPRLGVCCDYELKNFTSKIRFDNNVAKYFKDL